MTICAGVAAVGAVGVCVGVAHGNDAVAGVAGADLLGDFWHGINPLVLVVMTVGEEVLDHDVEDAVHAGIGHGVEDLPAASL